MVEVFKTNITKQKQAKNIIKKLHQKFPDFKINFDLEDCDNILRVENPNGPTNNWLISKLIMSIGFYIEPLSNEQSILNKSV